MEARDAFAALLWGVRADVSGPEAARARASRARPVTRGVPYSSVRTPVDCRALFEDDGPDMTLEEVWKELARLAEARSRR